MAEINIYFHGLNSSRYFTRPKSNYLHHKNYSIINLGLVPMLTSYELKPKIHFVLVLSSPGILVLLGPNINSLAFY